MQQTSIILPSGNPLRAMQGLARQIALPGEFAPERFPSFPALERTAVMGFNQPASVVIPASGTLKMLAFRQACWPVWADQDLERYAYQARWRVDVPVIANVNTTQLTFNNNIHQWEVANQLASATVCGVTGSVYPFAYPILGVDNSTGDGEWIYIPGGGQAVISIGGFTHSADVVYRLTYEIWSAPGEVGNGQCDVTQTAGLYANAAFAPQSANGQWIRPKTLGYTTTTVLDQKPVRVIIVAVGGATATFGASNATMGIVGVGASTANRNVFPLVQPFEFVNSKLPWYSTRTTAVAVLATNVTQILNKAGTVLAGRVSPQVQNAWAVPSSYVNTLHPAEKAWLPLETGVYTYVPPSTDMASFWDYTINTTMGARDSPVFQLENDALYNVMFLTAGAVAETMAVTATWHFEFRTSSALFQIAMSGMSLETLHQAQLALAHAGFFFENPSHKRILQKVVDAVKRVAPAMVKGLSYIHPAAGAAAQAIYDMTGSKKKGNGKKAAAKVVIRPRVGVRRIAVPSAKMTMAATSSKGSGITPGKRK